MTNTNTTLNTTTPMTVLDYLELNKLTPADLEIDVNYYINEFLVESSLNMIFAKASQGKSFLVLAIAIKLLRENRIKKCLYFDYDNSTMALKSRSLDRLTTENKNLTYIHSSKTEIDGSELLFKLGSEADTEAKSLTGYLIIIDSIRDFMGGRDLNSDKDIIPVMKNLKKLRESGATIIFLHHTQKDSNGAMYKGSTSFIDSVDVAFKLESIQVDGKTLDYELSVFKDRIPVNKAEFRLDTTTFNLFRNDYAINKLDPKEQNLIPKVQKVLEENPNGLNQSQLTNSLSKIGSAKTIIKYLDKFQGTYWIKSNGFRKGNAILYYPLQQTQVQQVA